MLTGAYADRIWRLVHEVRRAGFVTVLVSNAPGFGGAARERLDAAFDELVVSGEVGVPKPHPHIYAVAAERAGTTPERCLFVDDAGGNVRGAEAAGMLGHLHTDPWTTEEVVRSVFGL